MNDSPAAQIKKAFGDPLLTNGFQRKGSTWWNTWPELIHAVNLQKSDWSDSWYVNVGFFVRRGDPAAVRPAVNHCHFYYRLDSVFPDLRVEIQKLFALSVSMDLEDRLGDIRSLSGETLTPFLKGLGTADSLKAEYEKSWFKDGLVTFKGRELLGLPLPEAPPDS